MVAEIADIQDKGPGKNAILILRARGTDPSTGAQIAETLTTLVIRGDGGFGGQPGQRAAAPEFPDREPDARIALPTRADQALIYRLSGDRNPLHSDPWFAREMAGFPTPILRRSHLSPGPGQAASATAFRSSARSSPDVALRESRTPKPSPNSE